jgi:hypothetical protein
VTLQRPVPSDAVADSDRARGRNPPSSKSGLKAARKVAKAAHGLLATFARTIFADPDAESVRAHVPWSMNPSCFSR